MKFNKNILKLFLKLLISAVLLTVFLYHIELKKVFEIFSQISVSTIILAISVNIIAILVSGYKWKLLIPRHHYFKIILIAMIGRFYSIVLPGQIAGEGVKAWILGKGHEDAEQIAASVILDKITGVIGTLIICILGIICSMKMIPREVTVSIILCVLLLFIILFSLRNERFFSFINKICQYFTRFKKIEKTVNHLLKAIAEFKLYLKNPGLIFINIFAGCIYQLLAVLLIYVFSRSIQIDVGFFDYCWIFGIVTIALILPVTIAGLGVREGTFLGLLGWLGVVNEKALALSIAFLGMQLLDAIIGGAIHFTMIYNKQHTVLKK